MFVDWILIHVLDQLSWRCRGLIRENLIVDFVKTSECVNWSTFSLRSLEEIFSPWIKSLVWILSWPSSSSSTRWWIPQLSVRPLRVLLLHMSVESGVGQVSFVAVLAFEVSALVVVLAAAFASLAHSISILLPAATPLVELFGLVLVLVILVWLVLIHVV